ncbi:unnamed protein product [Closterium sp. NIES-53]
MLPCSHAMLPCTPRHIPHTCDSAGVSRTMPDCASPTRPAPAPAGPPSPPAPAAPPPGIFPVPTPAPAPPAPPPPCPGVSRTAGEANDWLGV